MGRNNIQRGNRWEFFQANERYQLTAQELQATSRRINTKKTTLRHIIVKILKATFRETLKAAREKKILYTGS